MGDALVVMTVSEETFMFQGLHDIGPDEREVQLAHAYGVGKGFRGMGRDEILRRHPNAYYRMQVRPGDIWELPAEPGETRGLDWHKDRVLRRAHRDAVRESLEQFLNTRLARLYHMVRTGWWVLGKARVRVVECQPVPEREMAAFARAFRNARGGPRKRRARSGEPPPKPRRRKE